jgi:hypothetical protein
MINVPTFPTAEDCEKCLTPTEWAEVENLMEEMIRACEDDALEKILAHDDARLTALIVKGLNKLPRVFTGPPSAKVQELIGWAGACGGALEKSGPYYAPLHRLGLVRGDENYERQRSEIAKHNDGLSK